MSCGYLYNYYSRLRKVYGIRARPTLIPLTIYELPLSDPNIKTPLQFSSFLGHSSYFFWLSPHFFGEMDEKKIKRFLTPAPQPKAGRNEAIIGSSRKIIIQGNGQRKWGGLSDRRAFQLTLLFKSIILN